MTAKELRQQALFTELYCGLACDELKEAGGVIESLARHILATLRDDDDEPFDIKNARNLVGNSVELQPGHLYLTIIVDDDNSIDSSTVCHEPRTMGQFRSLCKGLGIVLEEKST